MLGQSVAVVIVSKRDTCNTLLRRAKRFVYGNLTAIFVRRSAAVSDLSESIPAGA